MEHTHVLFFTLIQLWQHSIESRIGFFFPSLIVHFEINKQLFSSVFSHVMFTIATTAQTHLNAIDMRVVISSQKEVFQVKMGEPRRHAGTHSILRHWTDWRFYTLCSLWGRMYLFFHSSPTLKRKCHPDLEEHLNVLVVKNVSGSWYFQYMWIFNQHCMILAVYMAEQV